MAIELRLLKENEAHLANDFFNNTYKTNRSIENFTWEFLNGPDGRAIYVIAVDTSVTPEKIVGIQCAIPLNLSTVDGAKVLTAKSEDTLVDPAYRGQRIFENMYDLLFEECRKAGICFIWGFTPAKKAFERIGFEIPFQSHQALLVFNLQAAYQYLSKLNAANSSVDKLKIAGLTFLSWILSLKNLRLNSTKIELRKIPIQSKQKTIQELSPSSAMHYITMNERYLQWRILNNPFNNTYESYQFWEGGDLLADVLINVRVNIGYIEQMLFNEKITTSKRKEVIVGVTNLFRNRVALVRVLCFDFNAELVSQENLLRGNGYIVLKRGGYFVWKQLNNKITLDARQLFITRLFTQGNQ